MENGFIFLKSEFSEYIFLLVAAIAAIVQLIAKKREKEPIFGEEERAPSRRKTDEDPYFDMWEDEPKQEQKPAATVQPRMTMVEQQAARNQANGYVRSSVITPEEYASEVNVDHRAISAAAYRTNRDERKQPSMAQKIRKDFSLKNAVVYSEILNRKY